MAHIIDQEECISCGACADECPEDAIKEVDDKYEVDADACIDCGACEDVCPTGAIKEAE
ncbi:4Fe-4S binding protein [Aceticella autotrophica]|uniref:Ferredoxin n=1 Tax=Aceticella autotrophica TaxID=2755338 RepID=A0A975AUN0_9THEO|nr:4Fe-4S binding protein [Aceticella autotrophica]QSZ26763.1 4Fe-4S binding protein [Aceticella autotrophica]